MTALSTHDLVVCYGERTVLHDISLRIGDGDIFIIIGPNGSGKTTLLKAMAGLLPPASGRITLLGKAIGDYTRRDFARHVALVPQQLPVDFPFTVAEVVLMGRAPHLGLLRIEDKVDMGLAQAAMEFTDVSHLAGRRLDQLSGGERQRVIIARAICQQPEIILLDEPTASLDPAHQVKIMDLMERLRRERRTTIVMVSHDLNLAAMYGDRLLLLKEGRIQMDGEPGEVLTRERLEQCYGCGMLVDRHPLCDKPRVVAIPGHCRRSAP